MNVIICRYVKLLCTVNVSMLGLVSWNYCNMKNSKSSKNHSSFFSKFSNGKLLWASMIILRKNTNFIDLTHDAWYANVMNTFESWKFKYVWCFLGRFIFNGYFNELTSCDMSVFASQKQNCSRRSCRSETLIKG